MNKAFDLYARKCHQCGKRFESGTEWAYKCDKQKGKKGKYYFCSWRCLRQFDRTRKKAG